jgi:hypothetical protein
MDIDIKVPPVPRYPTLDKIEDFTRREDNAVSSRTSSYCMSCWRGAGAGLRRVACDCCGNFICSICYKKQKVVRKLAAEAAAQAQVEAQVEETKETETEMADGEVDIEIQAMEAMSIYPSASTSVSRSQSPSPTSQSESVSPATEMETKVETEVEAGVGAIENATKTVTESRLTAPEKENKSFNDGVTGGTVESTPLIDRFIQKQLEDEEVAKQKKHEKEIAVFGYAAVTDSNKDSAIVIDADGCGVGSVSDNSATATATATSSSAGKAQHRAYMCDYCLDELSVTNNRKMRIYNQRMYSHRTISAVIMMQSAIRRLTTTKWFKKAVKAACLLQRCIRARIFWKEQELLKKLEKRPLRIKIHCKCFGYML